jgi:hypothetical protein
MSADLIKDMLTTANDCTLAGIEAGRNAERRDSAARMLELRDALAGLYGLFQLYASRDDCPPWLKEWTLSHRAETARHALANYEAHAPRIVA